MTTQPEALRLADALTRSASQADAEDNVIDVARWYVVDTAAELRRQHSLIAELETQLAMASSANGVTSTVYPELYAARERIKELEAEVNVWKEAEEVSYAYIKKTNAALDVLGRIVNWKNEDGILELDKAFKEGQKLYKEARK